MERSDATQHKIHVLVAEDDPNLRRMIRLALERKGHVVEEVADGNALMMHLLDDRRAGALPDVVLSDLRMPGVSGLGVLEAVRAAEWPLPFVLMSGATESGVASDAQRLRAWVLVKPFELGDLDRAVREAAAERSPASRGLGDRERSTLGAGTGGAGQA